MISILELLAGSDNPSLTLAEIVRHTGFSRATAHAIVGELVAHGWLLREPDSGRYVIGPGFVTLARSARQSDHLDRWAGVAAHQLSERFGIAYFVARRTALDTITVADHVVPAPLAGDDPSPWFRHGQRVRLRPPICREFIAFEPARVRAEWLGTAPLATRDRLREVLDVVADRGYSIERMTDDHVAMVEALSSLDTMSEHLRSRVGDLLTELSVIDYLPGELIGDVAVVTVGAPIRDAEGHAVAAIVACPNTTLTADGLRELAGATCSAAAAISAQLS